MIFAGPLPYRLVFEQDRQEGVGEALAEDVGQVSRRDQSCVVQRSVGNRWGAVSNARRVAASLTRALPALRSLARKGHIVYDGKRLEEGPVPMNEKQRRVFEDIRDLIVERFGSTGVQEALSRAVDQARVLIVYPVKSIHTFVGSDGGVFADGEFATRRMWHSLRRKAQLL